MRESEADPDHHGASLVGEHPSRQAADAASVTCDAAAAAVAAGVATCSAADIVGRGSAAAVGTIPAAREQALRSCPATFAAAACCGGSCLPVAAVHSMCS